MLSPLILKLRMRIVFKKRLTLFLDLFRIVINL